MYWLSRRSGSEVKEIVEEMPPPEAPTGQPRVWFAECLSRKRGLASGLRPRNREDAEVLALFNSSNFQHVFSANSSHMRKTTPREIS